MKIIGASVMLPCDDACDINSWQAIRDGGVVIDGDRIVEVGDFMTLKQKYQNCDFAFYKHHILLPALINAHVHFEFSKNEGSFVFGDFGVWLDSMMDNRGEILKNNAEAINVAIKTQKRSGVGSVCAISSYDLDLEALVDSKLRVVFCHEIIGAMESNFDNQAVEISNRVEKTLELKNSIFTPALALHAPYSLHPKIAHYAVELALKYNLLISAHFLESSYELEWLEYGRGYFADFYRRYFGLDDAKPHFSVEGFLDVFRELDFGASYECSFDTGSFDTCGGFKNKVIFAHCLFASDAIRQRIYDAGHSIISCPRSNLLLNARMGDNLIIATDGKSSNIDVDILQEARVALFCGLSSFSEARSAKFADLEILARSLIYAMTCRPAKALGLKSGVLKAGKNADIAIFKLDLSSNTQSGFLKNEEQDLKLSVESSEGRDSTHIDSTDPKDLKRLRESNLPHTKPYSPLDKLLDCIATNFILNAKSATRLIVNGVDVL